METTDELVIQVDAESLLAASSVLLSHWPIAEKSTTGMDENVGRFVAPFLDQSIQTFIVPMLGMTQVDRHPIPL